MKTMLCISQHFPPVNAPDMQRLRQSISYFKEYNWRPVIFAVDPNYIEQTEDALLLESLPDDIEVYRIKAFSTKWTRKLALGNLGFRSWLQYRSAVDHYIELNKVDLIYFSTTVFTLMALGPHWKKKYGVPFIIDLQDPWRNDYYLSLDKIERPAKFWFDYRQKKFLESRTMSEVSGIVSVSDAYIETMKLRYPKLKSMKCLTLPFGALETDTHIAKKVRSTILVNNAINIVYVGRGGNDMKFSISALFKAFKWGLDRNTFGYSKIIFSFYGTSYAANGSGVKNITPIAEYYRISEYVRESTDRLPYFQSLKTLTCADILLIPGSVDEKYTASKVFPYILAKKPLLAIFNEKSSVVHILKETKGGEVVTFTNKDSLDVISHQIFNLLNKILTKIPYETEIDMGAFAQYSAREMTRKQCLYFDAIVK